MTLANDKYVEPNKLGLLINAALRVGIGGIVFWLCFYVIFDFYDAKMDLFSRIGIVIFFGSIGTLIAIVAAYGFWIALQDYFGWRRFRLKDLNRGIALYITLIGMIINAIFTALGVSGYIWGLSEGNWWRFFGMYLLYKCIAWGLAYLIGWPLRKIRKERRFIFYTIIGMLFMGLMLLGIIALVNFTMLQ